MRVAVLAVPFSDNLGDLLIYECVSGLLHTQATNAISVVPVDLAGRRSLQPSMARLRSGRLKWLERLPSWARPALPILYFGILKRGQLRRFFADALSQADVVFVGGGHLLADLNLNFPIKLSIAAREVQRLKLPVTIYGVGVSEDWTALGGLLFKAAIRALDPGAIAVRDEASARRLMQRGGYAAVTVEPDPALIASRLFPRTSIKPSQPTVGINVIGVSTLKTEAGLLTPALSPSFYPQLGRQLAQLGVTKFLLFTNGSADDEKRLSETFQDFVKAVQEVQPAAIVNRSPRPLSVSDLITSVSSCSVLISHRLHANILAYSYGVPSVGLGWDDKVSSFFQSVGRSQYMVEEHQLATEKIAQLTLLCLDRGIDRADVDAVQDRLERAMSNALNTLEKKMARNAFPERTAR